MSEKIRENLNGEWIDAPSNNPNYGDGGPAFPVHTVYQDCGIDGNSGPHITETVNYGMTLRDKFADSVLPAVFAEYAKTNMLPLAPDVKASIALECYSMAEAMLLAREVKQ